VTALKNQSCESRRITSKECNVITVKPESDNLGFVGTPTHIKVNVLKEIIKVNEVPVIAPLGLDKNNKTFNINADTVAGAIAKELKARRLMIISDVEGVLDDKKKLIPEINSQKAKELINQQVISGGMIPKINNCLDVASNGVKGVVIIDGRKNHSILFELLSDKGSGTLIRK
jgi:acetylglutamate kinase